MAGGSGGRKDMAFLSEYRTEILTDILVSPLPFLHQTRLQLLQPTVVRLNVHEINVVILTPVTMGLVGV